MAVLEELEETAKLWWMTRAPSAALPHGATPLADAQIDELRRAFGASW
jgi:3-dehydro-4-phosphotetronate decarboxylase